MTDTITRLGPYEVLPPYAAEQLVDRLGIVLTTCEPDLVTGTMPVAGNRQPIGLIHGGANAVLAETLGSVAAMMHAGEGGMAVGLDLSCTHHHGPRSGLVTGVCRPLHRGSTSATYEIVISDQRGRRTCTARLTCAITKARGRRRGSRAAS
ncbi:hotdog fold thioesterase [Micromonospora lupini]|uniref:hotdog fold thioesterase n=1 Tax=Micromonospora lupini TaxID=285679 RepID=UPI0031D9EE16